MRLRSLETIAGTVALLMMAAPADAFLIQEKSGPQSGSSGIALGADGNFWVAEEFVGDSVVRMSQSGEVLGRFLVGSFPTSVTTGPGGRVWVTVRGSDKVVWIDATASAPTVHNVPTGGISDCGPVGLAAGNNGRMYFSLPSDGCNAGASLLATVADDGTGPVTSAAGGGGKSYDLEVAGGKLFAPDFDGDVVRRLSLAAAPVVETSVSTSPGAGADGVTSDAAGNVWITEYNTGKIAKFPATQNAGAAKVFTPTGGTLTGPFGIAAGADGRMYVAGNEGANIARVSADGTSFAFYPVPDSEPFNVINGTDGDLWFTDRKKTRILRFINSAPRATTGEATATSPTTATATANINPRGNETQLVFEYGPTTAYGATSPPVTVANGADPVWVGGVLLDLTPATTYPVRARATNAEGSVVGGDTTFATPKGLVDADRDGTTPPADCNDANPAIYPGAVDKPGDKIDQDCSGKDAAYPELTATTTFVYSYGGRLGASTVVKSVEIARLRGGETATFRCKGRRCPFKVKKYRKLKKGKRTFGRKLFRGRRLRAGATISVSVKAPLTIGTSTVLKVRRNKAPKITRACLRPGSTKPSRCP